MWTVPPPPASDPAAEPPKELPKEPARASEGELKAR
jgi:hypothetical protein